MKITTSLHFGSCVMRIVCCAIFALPALLPCELSAQVRPIYDRGAVGLMQMLKRLNTSASVLMIGAHPDDEDTALLAYLARGESARTAYLSLTRGDGGQNIIGAELGEALGVIRTEELLQARRLDGAEQYFTRAYDYGFSKTLDEAKQKWDEKMVLCDAVRVIRNFRPLVVVAQFSGTPADGHGQHQFAGYIAPIAVRAAADASRCADGGPVWTVQKFYTRHRGQGEAQLRINTGQYDPLLGRTYFEIAMEARSQHKSQEQGVLELRGDQFSGLNLAGSELKESGILDGLKLSTTVELQNAIDSAIRGFDATAPEKILPHLARGYSLVQKGSSDPTMNGFLAVKEKQFADAIVLAAGLQIDGLADAETVVPGESIFIGAKAYTPLKETVKVKGIRLIAPERWTVTSAEAPRANSPAFVSREGAGGSAFFNVTVPADWRPTQPYWLDEPRDGDLFRWNNERESHTLPFQPSPVKVAFTVDVNGTEITLERPIEYRFADDTRGELRRNVDVVPAVSISLDKDLMIAPRGSATTQQTFSVRVTNNTRREISVILKSMKPGVGTVRTDIAQPKLTLKPREGATTDLKISVIGEMRSPPFDISIVADIDGTNYVSELRVISYPHMQTHRYYERATAKVVLLDLVTERRKIGYIVGSGDRVPDAIRQMGFPLEMISENELASGDLSKYDTIVVGIRAYQVRPDVVANNQRLLDYARNGGTLIVQYQLPGYAPHVPFPAQMGPPAPRVADENAKVTILDPQHPVFNFPNKITDADFGGWVQERNLYNFSTMDAAYTPLLESHDAGEAENKGGLVIAKVGKGNYIYCSYSFFRQLPAGVPGTYRLFANLLSLPKANKK